jgi:hypothetical protein
MDYLMFTEDIDSKAFEDRLLEKSMYSSSVTADGQNVSIILKKSGLENE